MKKVNLSALLKGKTYFSAYVLGTFEVEINIQVTNDWHTVVPTHKLWLANK